MDSIPPDLTGKLWNAAYAVTGFSVVQTITYLYATANKELRPYIIESRKLVSKMIVGFHLGYVGAIILCQIGIALIDEMQSPWSFYIVHWGVGTGQALVIAGFGVLAFKVTRLMQPPSHGDG